MRARAAMAWRHDASRSVDGCKRWLALFDAVVGPAAGFFLSVVAAQPWIIEAVAPETRLTETPAAVVTSSKQTGSGRETLAAGYAGAPFYYRSDVHLERPDGTDVVLKRLGWDGDALYFPIDGGIRSVEWWGNVGVIVDFLHNKAIARLGRGAHGRKLAHPVIEDVDATGTIAGKPVPPRVKLTDVFERLEFTHGHNVLLLTPLVRMGSIRPGIRPYFGLGFGFALPHVEVWFPGGTREQRTNEYQFAGAAAQFLAGLEFRVGKASYFIEYKFIHAGISGALTGDQSWKNFNMPGDMWRQFSRWWRGEPPPLGRITTRLGAHQIVGGAGYWISRSRSVAP